MLRIDSVAGPAGADRENSPRSFVTAMTGVPGTVTVAPATGCPEAELVTFPVMGRCWASAAPMPTLKLSASVMNQVRLTTAPPYLGAPQLQQRRELERQRRGVQQHVARQETPERDERERGVHQR